MRGAHRASQYQIFTDIVLGYLGFDSIRFSTFGSMEKIRWSATEQLVMESETTR